MNLSSAFIARPIATSNGERPRPPTAPRSPSHRPGLRETLLTCWIWIRPLGLQPIACRGRRSVASDASCHLRVGSDVSVPPAVGPRGVAQQRRDQTSSQVARLHGTECSNGGRSGVCYMLRRGDLHLVSPSVNVGGCEAVLAASCMSADVKLMECSTPRIAARVFVRSARRPA